MLDSEAKKIILSIKSAAGMPCKIIEDIQNESVLEIPKNSLRKVVKFLLLIHQPIHLTTITADIVESNSNQLLIYYNFWKAQGYALLIKLNRDDPELETIVDLIPGVDFYEREVAEMYGVHFTYRDATPPLLLPDDWDQKPPMLSEAKE